MVDPSPYGSEEILLGYEHKFCLNHRNGSDGHFHPSYLLNPHLHHHHHFEHQHQQEHQEYLREDDEDEEEDLPSDHLDVDEQQFDSFHSKGNRRRNISFFESFHPREFDLF